MMMGLMMKNALITDERLMKQAQQALATLKQANKDDKWVKFSDNPCKMYKMPIEDRVLSKGQAIINIPMKEMIEKLTDQSLMKYFNSQLKEINTLHKFQCEGKEVRINYMRFQGIWPVWDRDFVNVSVKQQSENTCFIASKNSVYPYATVNKVTRGTCYIAGYILQKINESSTLLTYISDLDLAGWIPKIFKNKLSERQAAMPKQIQKVLLGDFSGPQEQQLNIQDDQA